MKSRSLRNGVIAFSLLGVLVGVTGCRLDKGRLKVDSPIKVRGGAMTFRSKNVTWQQGTVSGATSPCYFLDGVGISSISTDASYASGGTAPSLNNLTAGWSMTLNGRNPSNPKQASPNGITIKTQDASCNGSVHTMILLPLSPTNAAAFYPGELQTEDGYMERFVDNSSSCQGPSGSRSGDEDLCERMSTISLVLAGSSTYNYLCRNGECEIDIY